MNSVEDLTRQKPLAALPKGALAAWWWQGLRSAILMRPNWRSLTVTPALIACLVIVPFTASVLLERLYIVGPVAFYAPALTWGWLGIAGAAWLSWLLVPSASSDTQAKPASASRLFAMFMAMHPAQLIFGAFVLLPLSLNGYLGSSRVGWIAWVAYCVWANVMTLVLIWRSSRRNWPVRLMAWLMMAGLFAMQIGLRPPGHWYSTRPDGSEAEVSQSLKLTQELMELQPSLLQAKLRDLAPGRLGRIDMYALTFAPYASEDVFRNESRLVAAVMRERFGTAGRTLELVNHPSTVREWPSATPQNLKRAIQGVAQVMNRDEDLLFIHFASHGARNGKLSAEFWPLSIESITPSMLKSMLDEAGIRWRVLSISACYSGSWIEPLAGPDTLVMTAADADHTSFGCGRGSDLTFFGRAMYDEEMRRTHSFEKAHQAAHQVIEQREKDAGKSDGFSNPQIREGEGIRAQLAKMELERESNLQSVPGR